MNAAMLAAVLSGQLSCSGGSCSRVPAPSLSGFAPVAMPGHVEPVYAPAAEIPMLKRYRIDHEGLDLVVEGWVIPGTGGRVTWEPDRPFNAKAVREARAARPAAQAPKAKAPTDGSDKRVMFPRNDQPAPEIGQVAGQPKNFGLAPDRIGKKGFTAKSEEARRFVAEATDPAPSDPKLHLTVIGPDDSRKAVLDDLKSHPALAPFRDALYVQDYRPGEWPVDPGLGFATGGSPTILIQEARNPGDPEGGKVVYRAGSYAGGPERLAEALRKAKPNYDPKLDPGPATGKSGTCPLGFTKEHWPVIVVVGAALLLIVVRLPRKEG